MVLGIFSVQQATFSAYAFNAYLVTASATLVLILYWPRRTSGVSLSATSPETPKN
jgi:hypothetical protein